MKKQILYGISLLSFVGILSNPEPGSYDSKSKKSFGSQMKPRIQKTVMHNKKYWQNWLDPKNNTKHSLSSQVEYLEDEQMRKDWSDWVKYNTDEYVRLDNEKFKRVALEEQKCADRFKRLTDNYELHLCLGVLRDVL